MKTIRDNKAAIKPGDKVLVVNHQGTVIKCTATKVDVIKTISAIGRTCHMCAFHAHSSYSLRRNRGEKHTPYEQTFDCIGCAKRTEELGKDYSHGIVFVPNCKFRRKLKRHIDKIKNRNNPNK